MNTKGKKADSQNKEKVVVFGEELNDAGNQKNEGVLLGVILLLFGIILLFNSFGIIPWILWDDLIKFWPLLLILSGLQIILGRNPISKIVMFFISLGVLGTAIIYSLQNHSPQVLKYIPRKFVEWSDLWGVIMK